MRRGVVMVMRIDPIAPSAAPIVLGKQSLTVGCGIITADGQAAAIEQKRQHTVVWDAAVILNAV
jgi:hypothetical protein